MFVSRKTKGPKNTISHLNAGLLLVIGMLTVPAFAGSPMAAGDMALRHDIQVLADYRIITGPVTTWPIDWQSVEANIRAIEDRTALPAPAAASLARVEARMPGKALRFRAGISAAEAPMAIRGFQNTPREKAELAAGLSWNNDRFNVDLNVQGVDDASDGKDFRADGSELGVRLGNWTVAASTMERWWGPGWDGSLILSNNARPIPSLALRRNETKAFETKWLSWLGPWDLRVMWGEMESDRVVPNANFFGMRFAFRPHPSLEIGLSRTAQLCGEGRPCGFSTFWDMFWGRDNVGDAGTTPENEPGNQLGGFDVRWSNTWFGTPMAFYAQMIGEDEAGGFPSRYLAMGGLELTGFAERRRLSWRGFAEFAGTSCDYLSDALYGCAYNHGIYETGYRYRGRVIGHGAEGDAAIASLGLVLVTEGAHEMRALIRSGELNKGGSVRNTLTRIPLDLFSADLAWALPLGKSRIELGVGYEALDDTTTGQKTDGTRAYLQWRYGY